ncbi:hypothetical protein ACHAXT_009986 [Thalassiosira profunda]
MKAAHFSASAVAIGLGGHRAASFAPPTTLVPHIASSPDLASPIIQPSPKERRRTRCRHPLALRSSNDDLLASLLNGSSGDYDPYSKYTHQIAIPLDDASELHAALHAIQTSLVRDCPRLLRACVMPALLRLPLLYVDGSALEGANVGTNNVDAILEEAVHAAIRRVVYGEDGSGASKETVEPILLPFRGLELQGADNSVLYAVGSNINDESSAKNPLMAAEDEEDGVIVIEDWSTAEAAEGPSGWEMLEQLVHAIQEELEGTHGLDTCWPLDEPQGKEIEYDDPLVAAVKGKQRKWRPRVPFVRLPKDFYAELQEDAARINNEDNSGDGGDEEEPSSIDMGFDGISPLFWYEAWGADDILEAPGVRMRSVAVYRRTVPGGGEAESSFYVATSADGPQSWKSGAGADAPTAGKSLDLPVGDTKLRARERREKAKAMDRLGEEEQRAEREWEEGKARWMEELGQQGGSAGDATISEDESYAQFDVGMEVGEVTVDGDAAYSSPWTERDVVESTAAAASIQDGGLPAEQIAAEEVASSAETERSSDALKAPTSPDSKPRRDLPSIEDNPVFQRLWKGKSQVTTQGQNTALTLDGTPPASEEPLPPYPSDAHFVGPWRVVSSPLGTSIDSIDDESKSSDNFILRVDGQVMGGPVLDAEYQHKAAGGEWRMFQAVRRGGTSEDGSEAPPVTQTRLRIRLLVPPEKDRALVMEGEVTRLVMPGAGDAASSSFDGWQMASGGILEGMAQNLDVQSQSGNNGEVLLYCGGEAWMEDADGGANRRKLGPFSLQKLKSIRREDLIYTVDVARPTTDPEEANQDDG